MSDPLRNLSVSLPFFPLSLGGLRHFLSLAKVMLHWRMGVIYVHVDMEKEALMEWPKNNSVLVSLSSCQIPSVIDWSTVYNNNQRNRIDSLDQ
ncbi:hypothetical protein E2C01_016852 [Portunus trituberculatus]|uniref:Uncharacterized protein n=1 Tax=Portunus trituberculatus TaxID=210409 RepID=A0A5B7DQV9_PORTR|nr:hypothetical protein [Portunus trituberculatus]